MSRRRFFIPPDSIREGIAALPADQVHHLRHVLRIGNGEEVEIFDGKGNGYSGKVELSGSRVHICGLQRLPLQELSLRLILAAALIKPVKFEWMLQKATELGVDDIVPLNTRLSDRQIPDGKITQRLDRWDRIAKEASKQSRRFTAPTVHAPIQFSEFLAADEYAECIRNLFYEKAQERWRPDLDIPAKGIVLCIGPEGGWDESEIEQARNAGCKIFGLGPRILRAETASIVTLAILQHHLDLSALKKE
jgi:16S rRNA (uracil1498-N3)-methyltransferase